MPIGVHVAKISYVLPDPDKTRKTLLEAIQKDCENLSLKCCQIFVVGPQNFKQNKLPIKKIKDYCNSNNITLYVHSNYGAVGVFSMTDENKNTPKIQCIVECIVKQLQTCDSLGAKGFVMHVSKNTPQELLYVLKVLYPLIKNFKTTFLLEQQARRPEPNATYETPEQINTLTKLITEELPDFNWGWCIDTAHLYAGGIEVGDTTVVRKWIKSLKYPKMIKLFHLNGMLRHMFNTGKDVHQVVFGDNDDIWKKDCHINCNTNKLKKSSITLLSKLAKKNNIDTICEIKRGEYEQIKFSLKILNELF